MQGGAAKETRTSLLPAPASVPQFAPQLDWRSRPARRPLGGWKCSFCLAGAKGLSDLAFYGVIYNLVIYLAQVCGLVNAAAASSVSNLTGTMLVCSFFGAVLSDAYVGRLWAALIFQIVSTLLYGMINIAVVAISQAGSATAFARSVLLVLLYLMSITYGPTLPILASLGADQLRSSEDIEKYFQTLSMMVSIGQLLAATLVTYVDNVGLWVWGFGLCTTSFIASTTVVAGGAYWFHQYSASGNPFLRNMQVLVAAWRKRSLPPPMDSSLLYECHSNLSVIPGQHKLQHTSTLGCLDKAAILSSKETFDPWHLCTVTQVEELKCLVRVLPVGIAFVLPYAANAQISTLFEEQASVMNRQVATWLTIPPASLNVVSIVSAIVTGIVIMAGTGTRLAARCFGSRQQHSRIQKPSSLQQLGVGIISSCMAMAVAALVEGHRLAQVQEGLLISVLWLMPQTILLGMCDYLSRSAGLDFFYNEVSESTRSVGGSFLFIFMGAGNYVSSILVLLVTVITTQGEQAGWIANDLDKGHVDYFYWFLTCFLALGFGLYIVYARSYVLTGGSLAEDSTNAS